MQPGNKGSFVNVMLLNYSKSVLKSLNNTVSMKANLTRVNYTVSMELITSLMSCMYKQDHFLKKNCLEFGTELDICLQ